MRVENTIMIERPINEVFEYISTPENDPTWVSVSLRHERTAPGPMRVGTTTEEVVTLLGRTASDTWEVTDYQPPTAIDYQATSGLLPVTAIRLRLEPVEGGTKLTHAVDLEPHGIHYKAIAPLIPWVAQRLLDSMDRTLKNLLEDKSTTLGPKSASRTMTRAIVAASVVAGIAFLLLRRRNRSSRS